MQITSISVAFCCRCSIGPFFAAVSGLKIAVALLPSLIRRVQLAVGQIEASSCDCYFLERHLRF